MAPPARSESIALLEQHGEHLRPGTDSQNDLGESDHPESEHHKTFTAPPEKLFRQGYLLFLVVLYGCLYIFAWVILCVQVQKPITTKTYGYRFDIDDVKGMLADRMQSNLQWFQTVKVILAVTNTLVIPLTSAVCASAAVVYVQTVGIRNNISMQQTSTLADKGWTNPLVWIELLTIKGWKSRGSSFLAFAILFHAVGFLLGPLQQYFVGQESFKVQTVLTPGLQGATDVFDLFDSNAGAAPQVPLQAAKLRNQLSSVSINDFQPAVWQEGTPHCSDNKTNGFEASDQCYQGGTTFTDISQLLNPYIAQLPASYQTGLVTQYLPRMNSSVSYAAVSPSEFPQDCKTNPAKYYTDYAYNGTLLNIQVCMPIDVSQSLWKSTRDRQDISEELFIAINLDETADDSTMSNITLKLTVNTTLGYFELPNYKNSGAAGPLLAKDPQGTCKGNLESCAAPVASQRSLIVNEGQSSSTITAAKNLGPIGLMAVALFEPGSFLVTQFNPVPSNVSREDRTYLRLPPGPCTVPPLSQFTADGPADNTPSCQYDPIDVSQGYMNVLGWLQNFYDIDHMQNAFHAGAILASQVWLGSVRGSLTISHDLGEDSERPKVSSAGVILLSVLLAIDLILLFGVALYGALSPKWTSSLDSSAMLRQGAARADDLSLRITHPDKDKKFRLGLEEMPGWVGDGTPDNEMGTLAVGASTPLRPGRKYCAG